MAEQLDIKISENKLSKKNFQKKNFQKKNFQKKIFLKKMFRKKMFRKNFLRKKIFRKKMFGLVCSVLDWDFRGGEFGANSFCATLAVAMWCVARLWCMQIPPVEKPKHPLFFVLGRGGGAGRSAHLFLSWKKIAT